MIQVRKSYEQHRARRRARGVQRPWQLRRLAMEEGGDDGGAEQPPAGGRGGGGSKAERKAAEAAQADRERFIEVSGCLVRFPRFPVL